MLWNVKHDSPPLSPSACEGVGHPCAFEARPGLARYFRTCAVVSAPARKRLPPLLAPEESSSRPLAHAHPLRCQIRQSMVTRALFLHLSASLLYSSPSCTAICSQFWPCFEASWTSFIIYFLGSFKVKTISSYGHSYHRHTGNFFPSLTWSLMSSLPFGRPRSFIDVLGFQ